MAKARGGDSQDEKERESTTRAIVNGFPDGHGRNDGILGDEEAPNDKDPPALYDILKNRLSVK
jgi:hypothetical protein